MPSRPMFSMLARTPMASSTRSEVSVSLLPSAVVMDVVTFLPAPSTFTPPTLAPRCRLIFFFLNARASVSLISSSSMGVSRGSASTMVTSAPKAFQKSANSTPMAPAPITTTDLGSSGSTIASR